MSGALPGPDSAMAPPIGRIRTHSTFRALARPDGRASSGPLRVAYVGTSDTSGLACVGYAVGRRHGNAVARNRLRRRLRAAVREIATSAALPPGAYLVSARPGAGELGYAALQAAVGAATMGAATMGAAQSRVSSER